jgi:regulator of RNase E activity RraA
MNQIISLFFCEERWQSGSCGTVKKVNCMEVLRKAGASIVGDALGRLGGVTGLKRYDDGQYSLVGRALTLQTRAGDNLAILAAISRAQPGEVLVVDGAGSLERALVGDLARAYAIQRGLGGFVINGAIRDVSVFRQGEPFACFARGVSHRGPFKDGPGRIGQPVSIGGQVISTGDIVVADDDGMVSFEAERLEKVLELVAERVAAEDRIRAEILSGSQQQSWLEAMLAGAGDRLS